MTQALNISERPLMGLREDAGEKRPVAAWRGAFARMGKRRVPSKLLLTMTSQLATMLGSGCDLYAGLEAMGRQQRHPRMREVMRDLQETVKAGQAFSTALARHPDVFSPLYVTMIRAGESSGLMRNMLGALQVMIRNQIRVTTAVRSALLYPCILITVALAAIMVMTTFVLPRFAAIFKSANAALPLATTILLNTTEYIGKHAVVLLGGLACAVVAALWAARLPSVRRQIHAWVLRLPLVGYTVQLSCVVRSIQTMGMLIKSGLPLAEALVLVRDLMPNVYYREFFEELRVHISEGKPLAPDFDRSTLFPPMVAQMISVGEQTGTLSAVCLEVASFHEEEMHERIKVLTTALEPLIIIVLGGAVGFIAISVILPMFRISGAIGH